MNAYEFSEDSHVSVSVASKPVFGMSHTPTFSARPKDSKLLVKQSDERLVADVELSIAVGTLDPGPSHSRADREKMLSNLAGKDVLDAQNFPTIVVKGVYEGTQAAGTLATEVRLRGVSQRVTFSVSLRREGNTICAEGQWEGTLTNLGMKPFRALLGALTLKDWVRLSFCVTLIPSET